MADNTNLPGTGELIALDELTTLNGAAPPAGLKVQRIKIGFGTDGIFRDVDLANGLPVVGPVTDTQLRATPVTVTMVNTLALTDTQLRATPVPFSAAALPLPAGAAAEATLAGVRTDLGTDGATPPVVLGTGTGVRGWLRSIYEKLTGTLTVTGAFFQATQPVSAAALPLPAGAATEATLAAVNTKMPALGQAVMLSSQPVAIASNQTAIPVSGAVSVTANGVISTANSSAVAMAALAVFTGTAEDVTEFADIRITVFANQPSATDGLQIQQSHNGTDWDILDTYTLPAATGRQFSVAAVARFFRVVYTNGPTTQTAFRLQTKFHKSYGKGSSVRSQDARSNENDFDEMLAFNMGYNGTSWDRLRSTIANGLVVDVSRIVAPVIHQSSPLTATITAAANTAVTLSLPPVAAQFHYITGIEIMRTSTAALAGTATLVVTTTNIAGALAWSLGNAMAAGATQSDVKLIFASPIKSSVVNTATTIVMPLPGAAVLWRANVYYYTAA